MLTPDDFRAAKMADAGMEVPPKGDTEKHTVGLTLVNGETIEVVDNGCHLSPDGQWFMLYEDEVHVQDVNIFHVLTVQYREVEIENID